MSVVNGAQVGSRVALDGTTQRAPQVLDARGEDAVVAVCGWVSDLDGAHVVQIDTSGITGRVRVMINDGPVYDGDPETDAPPGAYYQGASWEDGRRLFYVRSLMTGETVMFHATGQADATAQYLDVVASNLMVWEEPHQGVTQCDECGADTDELVSPQHGSACSLHPSNCVGTQTEGQR